MDQRVFVAGSFDRIHKGHEHVLNKAFLLGCAVTVGITSDLFIDKYKSNKGISSFIIRRNAINEWINNNYPNSIFEIISIDDPFEPAASGNYSSIIITDQNEQTGEKINEIRQKRGLLKLDLIKVDIIVAEDGNPIASTRIREGHIDQNGKMLVPETLRPLLGEPLGRIVPQEELEALWHSLKDHQIITVGDRTTFNAFSHGLNPILSIIDHKERRKPVTSDITSLIPNYYLTEWVLSGPGFISESALEILEKWKKERSHMIIVVDGEEDLLVLPVVLIAPLKTKVYYGQPEVGLVEVEVTEKIKDKAKFLLSQFIQQ